MDDYARFVLDRAKAGKQAPSQKVASDPAPVPAPAPIKKKKKRRF
jgi:hypothetical protein